MRKKIITIMLILILAVSAVIYASCTGTQPQAHGDSSDCQSTCNGKK